MSVTIVLVTLVYLLPLLVAISIDETGPDTNFDRWTDGHFAEVAAERVGEWLSAWISLGGALSAVGLLNTLLCTSARVAVSSGPHPHPPKRPHASHH
jgi:amino acid transporter